MTRLPRTLPHRRVLRTREQPRRLRHAVDLATPPRAGAAEYRPHNDALGALIAENVTLMRELARVQQRASQWRDEYVAHIDRLDALVMQARAQAIAKDTLLAAQRESLDALRKRAAVWLTNEELLRRLSDLRARNRSLESELAQSRRTIDAPRAAHDPAQPAADIRAPASMPALAARCVLCVGGRTRQLPQYRTLVERDGGRFAHTSGGADDDLEALDKLLDAADLVILQTGYVCQRACRVVEAHCTRTGKPCVLLAKPCAQAFALSLGRAHAIASP